MNILSLFDGMSCGHIALERTGCVVDKYYASEVDPFAIKVSSYKYPKTLHLGDVKSVNGKELGKIDLIMGGSPCQGFSSAGSGLAFDDPRSVLFFEYVRVLNELREINPDILFLLENVKMARQHELIITKILGIRPIRLNSSLVSAQNRQRLYWTNIPVNTLPEDKKIYLLDILEDGTTAYDKAYTIDANYFKGGKLTSNSRTQSERRNMVIQLNESKESGGVQPYQQNREYSVFGKSPALLSTLSSQSHYIRCHTTQPRTGKGNGGKGPLSRIDGKSYCLDTGNGMEIEYKNGRRKLSVVECCRLQNVPDDYFEGTGISKTQAYKMLGNGWTIDIIVHLLKHIPK